MKRKSFRGLAIGCGLFLAAILACSLGYYLTVLSGPDAFEITAYHPFRSVEAQEQFFAVYDEKERNWPVPFETLVVETSYGSTYVRISGPENGLPLVLLHGAGSNSLVWESNVKELSQSYRVIAIDNIYDYGRSIYSVEMKSPDDFVIWLDEVFTYLELGNDINLVGLSYGGWLVSQYALNHPGRLEKIVLIAPPATVHAIRFEWAVRAMIATLPHRYFQKGFVYWIFEDSVDYDEESRRFVNRFIEESYLNRRWFKPKMMVNPTVLKDTEIMGIEVPMLLIVGENEKMYSPSVVAERLRSLNPAIVTEIIPDAGHDVTILRADQVNTIILDFLGE